MSEIMHLDLAIADQAEILRAVNCAYLSATNVLHIISSDDAVPTHEIHKKDGYRSLRLPWLPDVYEEYLNDSTEICDRSATPDALPHKDLNRPESLNVHVTTRGRANAFFAASLGPRHFDDNGDVIFDMSDESRKASHSILSITVAPGDVLCFRGGAIAHQFSSLTPDRRSYVKSFIHTAKLSRLQLEEL